VDTAHPSTEARQQCFQEDDLLCTTGFNQVLKAVKYLLFFPRMTELDKPAKQKSTTALDTVDMKI